MHHVSEDVVREKASHAKVFVFDLDGTLAPSKSALEPDMKVALCNLLDTKIVVIISGGGFSQINTQVIARLTCDNHMHLSNLLVFPENGSSFYKIPTVIPPQGGKFKKSPPQPVPAHVDFMPVYRELLSEEDSRAAMNALKDMMQHFGIDPVAIKARGHGEVIEHRGGQITLSALGQKAPLSTRSGWDPTGKRRFPMRDYLAERLPNLEIRIGGTTSIDITRKGITKRYAINKLLEYLGPSYTLGDLLFFGDALYKGGNDSVVEEMGVASVYVDGPQDTLAFLHVILEA